MARLLDGPAIDYDDPSQYNGKIMSEKETRAKLLYRARCLGGDCEIQMKMLLAKIDGLMRNCTNDAERIDIGALGSSEVFKLLDFYGKLFQGQNLIISR